MSTSWDDLAIDGRGHLLDLAAVRTYPPPPDLTWTKIEQFELTTPVYGQFVAISDGDGIEKNLRVVSDLFADDGGRWVKLITVQQWQEWEQQPEESRPATPRRARAVPTRYVWVLHEAPQMTTSDR